MGTAAMRKYKSSRNVLAATASRKILVRGRQNAHVDVHQLRSADALEASLLEHAQQLGLRGQGQFGNFIQENRAAIGELHFSDLARSRSGIGAALVSEEFVFHQALGNRGAIQRDERDAAGAAKDDEWRARTVPCRFRFAPAAARWSR